MNRLTRSLLLATSLLATSRLASAQAPSEPEGAEDDAQLQKLEPVKKLGDARWTPGAGLVREAPADSSLPDKFKTPGPVTVNPRAASVSTPRRSGLGGSGLRYTLGFSYVSLSIPDEVKDQSNKVLPGLEASGYAATLMVQRAWHLFAIFGLRFHGGGQLAHLGAQTTLPSVFDQDEFEDPPPLTILQSSAWANLRLNMSLGSSFTVSGFGGIRLDHYKPSSDFYEQRRPGSVDGKSDLLTEYGLRAAINFDDWFIDGAYFWRQGDALKTSYLRLQAVIPDDEMGVSFWYETRLSTEGTPRTTPNDTIGHQFAYNLPMTTMIGIGFGGFGW